LIILPKLAPHPAKFSRVIVEALVEIAKEHLSPGDLIYDPFAGVGRIHELRQEGFRTAGTELEPEWAVGELAGTCVANALQPPFPPKVFQAIITSPCYGNRMADHHEAKDGSRRNTYKHKLGRDLSKGSTAVEQWGGMYQHLHIRALLACDEVLEDGGLLVLNASNHIRKGKVQKVVEWYCDLLFNRMGYFLVEIQKVKTPRQLDGANHHLRVPYEHLIVARSPG
jgi:tRNA G10  N-methylase Trm11